MRVAARLVVACLLVVASAVIRDISGLAVQQEATVSGVTVDPAGQPVPGVTVTLKAVPAGQPRVATSDAQGAWKFEKVPFGDYELRASIAGFRTTVAPIQVRQALQPAARLVMQVGDVSETVTVQSSPVIGAGPRSLSAINGLPSPPPPAATSPASARAAVQQYQLQVDGLIPQSRPYEYPGDTASYSQIQENKFLPVTPEHGLSTFSIDVDSASYSNVRRFLNEGRLPPVDAVRIEELINYFRFDYPEPRSGAPVSITTELGAAPWNPKHKLALIGLRATPVRQERTPPRNLTFLLDVSGSMAPSNRLPLIKTAMKMLVDTLRSEDTVSIVVYAGNSGLALKATKGDRKDIIQRAIAELQAAGSTNGAAGIQLAYQLASDNFIKDGINRVILATDGDFNVGVTSHAELVRLIEEKRERGIFLSVLGVGDNNLKDSTMESLADKGNGNYSYLDSLQEARRVLIAEAGATLVTVAKDVKVQIEFNPRFVSAYRLIGYENRMLRSEDFKNDRKDAGDMGAGHTVTALYEIVPPGEAFPNDVDPLKYQPQPKPPVVAANTSDEIMTVKVRYKQPDGDTSKELVVPVRNAAARLTPNLGFAAAVAEYGLLLRHSEFRGAATWAQVVSLAREHRGRDEDGYRAEFVRLAELAAALDKRAPTTPPLEARR
jgi:Ca-activated chloride channel homolog